MSNPNPNFDPENVLPEDEVFGDEECEICHGKGEYIEIDQVVKCQCRKVALEEDNADANND